MSALPQKADIQTDVADHARDATPYDKLAANYPAFIELTAIRIWLRVYESTS